MNVGSQEIQQDHICIFEVRTSPGTYSNRVDPRNYLP